MAATELDTRALLGGLVLAACALPGVMPADAHAEEAPERAVIAFKLSGYSETQPSTGTDSAESEAAGGRARALATTTGASGGGVGGSESGDERMQVTSPSMYALVPIGRHWAVEGSLTVDDVSGASPTYYTDMAGAGTMQDRRTAFDAKLTRYFDRQSVAFGVSRSQETDYLSQAVSLEGRFATDDQNTTFNVGLGLSNDHIDPSNHKVDPQTRRTSEFQVGVTQAMSSRDLAQLSYTSSRARGYLNDPYKLYDERPRGRNADILQLRWNHWLGDSALKLGYRFYQDSYRVQAHTFELAWAVPVQRTVVFTPELRYHTQGAASFYYDRDTTSPNYPAPDGSPTYYSSDQRLAAWGAVTLGAKLSWQFSPGWTADAKLDSYRQNTGWRLGGGGSPGLQPLSALFWQLGLSHSF
ncbi:DUF3570 domain-containing protein [Ideonella sp.]|uniref:DUF3570 domain-containing protein n=1 Tax=Ideonella sp. TaxID=1929293 RepID=UPI002B498486|nr:DUF3570 domain-containing protein [Ideonella sp.]HJV71997.1 DUF3570 domain-containing protein [Ideonella sp.]